MRRNAVGVESLNSRPFHNRRPANAATSKTQATRFAKYLPGTPIAVEVTGELTRTVGGMHNMGGKL